MNDTTLYEGTAPLSLAAHTLGCKVNQCDTDALLAKLTAVGLKIRNFSQPADIYIINTCTVTHSGDKKSLQMIRRARRLSPRAFIAVCGCMPRGQAGSASKITLAGADFTFDTRKPEDLLTKLVEVFPGRAYLQSNNCALHRNTNKAQESPIHDNTTANRTRAFIKIQDGCNRYCSYCIVPYVRGPIASRPQASILAEAAQHISRGIKEIVITGIQVAAYGYDTGNETLPGLIQHMTSQGPARIRLSSLDPWAVDDAFLKTISNSPALCDHFHLSLQSGCDKTLANMNRRYTTADYASAASKLRKILPNMALTTDIIVGFPGESDEDFNQSLQFAHKMGFAKIHVFEYSPRAGTPAAEMQDQVPSHVKSARGEAMRALAKSLEQSFLQSQIGKQAPVLFESKKDATTWQGHTTNYCTVQAHGSNLANTVRNVIITSVNNDGLVGDLL